MQAAVPTTAPATPVASDFRFSQLHTAMASTTLSKLPWTTKKGLMTSIKTTCTVKEALNVLTRENILSVPVFDANQVFKGFCDYQMLARFVVRLADGQIPTSVWWDENDKIRSTTVWDLMYGYGTSGRAIEGEWTPPVSEQQSLYECVQAMAQSGNHRIGIMNAGSSKVESLMTQSVVVRWLNKHAADLGKAKSATVSEMRPFTWLVTIRENETAMRAFELMDQKRTSQNGVAVVDAKGKLVDVISTHDLRGITPGSAHFDNLWKTVKQFKQDVNQRFNADKQQGLYCCLSTDTLETILGEMVKHKVHRLVVVDSKQSMVPIDMISQTDVLRFIVQKSKPMFF
jgi:CBS domain-containing protein